MITQLVRNLRGEIVINLDQHGILPWGYAVGIGKLLTARSGLYRGRFLQVHSIKYQCFSIFRDLWSPLSGEKKCEHFSSPEKKKKNIWQRGRTLKSQHRLGRPSETGRPGVRLWRPRGLFTLYVGSTLGLRWVVYGSQYTHGGRAQYTAEYSGRQTQEKRYA